MDYALGKISYISPRGNATIEVKGFCKDGKWYNLRANIKKEFPPWGNIFASRFQTDFPSFKQYDYICVDNWQENPKYPDEAKDKYIFSKNADGEAWQCAEILENITDEDLCVRRRITSKTPEEFYFFREKDGKKYICGPLNAENKLAPVKPENKLALENKEIKLALENKEIMAWEFQEGDCIDIEGTKFLIAPEVIRNRQYCFKLDCMSKDQFIRWVKDLLEVLQKPASSYTPEEMLEAIKSLPPNEELAVSRLQRLKDNIELLITAEISVDELKSMPAFTDKINEIIAAHKEEFLADAQAELQQLEKEIDQKKDELQTVKEDYELKKIAIEKEQNEVEKSLSSLKQNRETLIEDIRLQAEIFGGSNSGNQAVWSYPLEKIDHDSQAEAVVNWGDIISQLQEIMEHEDIDVKEDFFKGSKKLWQVKDIREGVFLAHISGNAVYQLCQPSPDWLSFKNFWDESLNVIWKSAHANPDKWHFLLIENYNIALPECWMMPLWNIIQGKTSLLPCAKNPQYPQNLRVIVSAAPTEKSDDSEKESYSLGLPTKISVKEKSLVDHLDWSYFVCYNKEKFAVNEAYYIPVNYGK